MKRIPWLAAVLIVAAGLSAGCANKPATSAPPVSGSTSGPPKNGDNKAKAVKGGIENPPPP